MGKPRASRLQTGLHVLAFAAVVGVSGPVSAAGGRGGQRSVAEELLHGPGVTNHPVGVPPSAAVNIPPDWPLDDDGTVTCLTCHERIGPSQGATRAYLRDFAEGLEDPTDFCTKCHVASAARTAAAVHWMAVPRAHIMAEATRGKPSRRSLDAHSRRCMGCHDGVSASDAGNSTPWNRGRGFVGARERNHPVGVPYPTRTPRNFSVRFRPAALLP